MKTTGINIPTMKAAIMYAFFFGEIGAFPAMGISMILPLVAVEAKVMAFSSRFCNNMVYKFALISC